MSLPEIKFCPSSLQPGFATYSPAAQHALFGSRSKKVSHILSFGPPGQTSDLTREYNEKRKTLSISGVQEKYGLLLVRNELKLTASRGTHILKPATMERLELLGDMPANEHVTMQIAHQLFGIKTAACGLIFFNDGSPGYITKRFDYKADGTKYQIEDFAGLSGKSPQKEGDDYKYNASYLDMAMLIKNYVPASKVELINFFRLVLFNYLFANGDAHLKNFSLMESDQGDYLLAPAYDLMCTRLHIDDADLALHDQLYTGDLDSPSYQKYGIHTGESFMLFAEKAGIVTSLAVHIIEKCITAVPKAMEMIDRSFLSPAAKGKYKQILAERVSRFGLK